jgi:hypothetical protein
MGRNAFFSLVAIVGMLRHSDLGRPQRVGHELKALSAKTTIISREPVAQIF